MATDIQGDVARVEAALNTPTLKLLDRKSAVIALPVFASLFPENAEPMPVERFHTRVDALLDELRAAGHGVTTSNGKALARQWVRERWLYQDPGTEQETYRLTGDAEQALEYVTRATRTQLNVSRSRIETMRRVVSEAALLANPDRDERKRRLSEEIARLTAEYERLDAGGDLHQATETELIEQFSNVLRELDGLPADFRRVEEAVRDMHRTIAKRFREEDHAVGAVLDEYLDQAKNLMEATPEGRAFAGAQELLRQPDWLSRLRADINTILAHPLADALLPDESRQLSHAVDVIKRGRDDVLDQRKRLSTTLREHIENYDHIRNRELEQVLRGIDAEMRTWLHTARARDGVEVDVVPPTLDMPALKLRLFDPDSERAPEPLTDMTGEQPEAPSLDELRKQGGPSLEQLGQRIADELTQTGALDSAAELFNQLPDELRRPVEILGLMHLLARLDADFDPHRTETVHAIRSDGSARSFLMPAGSIAAEPTQLHPDHEGGAS